VTRGWLTQRAGSPIPVGGGDAATVPPEILLMQAEKHTSLLVVMLLFNAKMPSSVLYKN